MVAGMSSRRLQSRGGTAVVIAAASASVLAATAVLANVNMPEEAAEVAALAADELCDGATGEAGEEGECALNALQRRMRREVAAASAATSDSEGVAGAGGEAAWGSCTPGQCAKYIPGQSCQCNDQCSHYGNCCSNYHQVCDTPVPSPTPSDDDDGSASCTASKCEKYIPGQSCQCNAQCSHYGNCCSNYEEVCNAPAPTPSPSPSGGVVPVAPSDGSIFGHPTPGKAYPEYPGFSLTLVEEFDAPIDLDSDPIWTWSDGGLIEGQIRFTKENILFKDGKMMIEVRDESAHDPQTCSAAEVAEIPVKKMTSGEMRTRHNWFRYGRYEARMKAPSVQPGNTLVNGNYVSTMFVYRDAKFKHWREIDFEITGDSTGSVTTNVLSADNTREWRAGIQESIHHTMLFNDRAAFHDYAFEWLPDKITWYVDGKKIREFKGSQVKIPELSGKIMMNMWMFDDRALFGGPEIKNNRYPMHNEYDWFRFYKWDGDNHYPCPGLSDSCLTPDDKYLSKNNPCDGIAQEGQVYGKTPCATHCR